MITKNILYLYNKVVNGKLIQNNQELFNKFIKKFEDDTELEFIIREVKDTRSLKLNRTYWLYLTMIEEHTGINKDDIHDLFKDKYLATMKRILHQNILTHTSTSNLNNKEFCEYLEKIKQFCSEDLNLVLPDPE